MLDRPADGGQPEGNLAKDGQGSAWVLLNRTSARDERYTHEATADELDRQRVQANADEHRDELQRGRAIARTSQRLSL